MSLSLFWLISSNDLRVVDPIRLSLEARSAHWFSLVKYSGYAVALGCAMEAHETFLAIKRWWLLKFRNDDRDETDKEKRSWFKPVAAIGLLIIVVGIVIETYGEGIVSDIDGRERAHEADKLQAAEDEAAAATLQAGAAATSAQHATTDAQTARSAAGDAGTEAVNAKTSAFEAEQHAIKIGEDLDKESAREHAAEQQLEEEKVKRTKLAASLLPRDFFDQSGAVAKLSAFPRMSVVFEFSNESEPQEMAEQFAFVFFALNWKYGRWSPKHENFEDGITISPGYGHNSTQLEMSACEAIRDGLQSSGIEAHVGTIMNGFEYTPSSNILISVGRKPNPLLEQALKELGTPQNPTPANLPGTTVGRFESSHSRATIPVLDAPDKAKP